MSITVTDLRYNVSKYLKIAKNEDVFIKKNGKVVAKLTNPYASKVKTVKSLAGILEGGMSLEEAKRERLMAK